MSTLDEEQGLPLLAMWAPRGAVTPKPNPKTESRLSYLRLDGVSREVWADGNRQTDISVYLLPIG